MSLISTGTEVELWYDTIKQAESKCGVNLAHELEAYLVYLLGRYTKRPELTRILFARDFLVAWNSSGKQRQFALQQIGDQCLLYAGFFPDQAKQRNVNLIYFVNLGRLAYSALSQITLDIYEELTVNFVVLMDVLQTIPHNQQLLPLDAYTQWQELGSARALAILQTYTQKMPIKNILRYLQ